jgi:hypothetical protein
MEARYLRKVYRHLRLFPVTLLCACLGCGSNLATVTGTVTLDNKPLVGNEQFRGTVEFAPEGGHGTRATGYLDDNGRYSLSSGSRVGVLPGNYLVSVTVQEILPSKIPGGAPSARLVTPKKYTSETTSGLSANVAGGKNTFDFALSSHP